MIGWVWYRTGDVGMPVPVWSSVGYPASFNWAGMTHRGSASCISAMEESFSYSLTLSSEEQIRKTVGRGAT